MTARLARWWLVAVTAWGLRHGIAPIDMLGLLARALPRRDPAWRLALLQDAERRNEIFRMVAGG